MRTAIRDVAEGMDMGLETGSVPGFSCSLYGGVDFEEDYREAPGSSIMPGKVNPVIPEVTNQVCFKVIGNDTTVSFAAEAGQLELNVMEPIITESLFESLTWLRNVIETLTEECILGITVNKEHCYEMVKNSIGIVTALNPIIGYKKSSMVAKEAHDTGRSVYDIVIEKGLMTKEELDKALDPKEMLQSHKFTLK